MEYYSDQVFEKIKASQAPLLKGEYEQCRFVNCDFAEANFSEFKFLGCEFESCNLSLAKLNHTAFQDVTFKNCKLLGAHFDASNDFGLVLKFEKCVLDHASFYRKKLKGISILNCQLHETDFTECDLSQSIFDGCDLLGAIFDQTNLERADLRTAINFSINPQHNRIKRAKFSQNGLAGLLLAYDLEIE